MKIVAALPNHHGQGYHRGLVPLRALAARGHTVAYATDAPGAPLPGGDVLYLPLAQSAAVYEAARAFRAAGGRIVYEFDDDYRATPATNPVAGLPWFAQRVAWMDRIMAFADVVTAASPVLAAAYRAVNPRIAVCRNSLDPADLAPFLALGEPEPDGEIRIGFGGSLSHADDVRTIVAPLTRVLAAHPEARFVMAGSNFSALFPAAVQAQLRYAGHSWYVDPGGVPREFCAPGEEWPVLRYYRLLASLRLHLAIAPLVDDRFNRGKSDLKLLEYGALGLPAVASDAGPYAAYRSEQGGAGAVRFATDDAGWEAALTELVRSASLRERLRAAHRANVRARHLIEHRLGDWEAALAGDV